MSLYHHFYIICFIKRKDKYKDIEILLGRWEYLKLSVEVIQVADNNSELLNTVYKEISEKLGMDTALEIYQMFKGQQISFPMRFFNPTVIQKLIVKEYFRLSVLCR